MYAYVFTFRVGSETPFYERTFPIAFLTKALQWIKDRDQVGFVSIDCLPPRYFY